MDTNTPRELQKNLEEIDFSSIPNWQSSSIQNAFEEIRDSRFLIQDGMPDFLRRIPWFYTMNGCFLRAALVRRKILELGLPGIKKLFIFGQMRFRSHPHLDEIITFKDHVAAVFQSENEIYVIDPPMCFNRPLRLQEWITALFVDSEDKTFQLCLASEFTLSHNSSVNAKSVTEELGIRAGVLRDVDFFTQDFLKKEYELVKSKNLSIENTLGDKPIWLPNTDFNF